MSIARERARAFATALQEAGSYRFAEPDRLLGPQQAPTGGDDFAATDWRTFLLGGLVAPSPAGAPVTAVIDTAVDTTHPDLAGVRVIGETAVDELHGTAVASLVGGRANGFGMVGIVPGAPVLAIGTPLSTSAITRSIATAVGGGAKVVDLSLGGPVPSYSMYVEIAYAASLDVVVVAPVTARGASRPSWTSGMIRRTSTGSECRRARSCASLRMPRDADPDLAVYSTRGRSIHRSRGRVGESLRGPGLRDVVRFRNSARRPRNGYVVVYAPTAAAGRIDAPYSLSVERLR